MPDDECAHQALAHAMPAHYACIMLSQPIFKTETVYASVTDYFRWFASYRPECDASRASSRAV